jgi:hypothetical protein
VLLSGKGKKGGRGAGAKAKELYFCVFAASKKNSSLLDQNSWWKQT